MGKKILHTHTHMHKHTFVRTCYIIPHTTLHSRVAVYVYYSFGWFVLLVSFHHSCNDNTSHSYTEVEIMHTYIATYSFNILVMCMHGHGHVCECVGVYTGNAHHLHALEVKHKKP